MPNDNPNSVTWKSLGVLHVAEFRTRNVGNKVATDARVNNEPWQFFCLNIDENNAVSVGLALVRRIARENGWRENEDIK